MLPLLHSPNTTSSLLWSRVPSLHVHSSKPHTSHQILEVAGGQRLPESTTKRIPSMVTEVSAMLVERMHFRTPGGATSNTWGIVKRRRQCLVFLSPQALCTTNSALTNPCVQWPPGCPMGTSQSYV